MKAEEGTAAYWRKLLGLDEPGNPALFKLKPVWQAGLRPAFYHLLGLIFRSYCPVKVVGLENLPPRPPYIIAANHASSMDFAVVAWAMGKRREELFALTTKLFYDIAFTRFWIKLAANAVRIDTVADFFPALRAAAKVLLAGKAVYINPEGTRSVNGAILPFRPGVGLLSIETSVPIIPVYLKDTWKVLRPGSILPRPARIEVRFDRPLDPEAYRLNGGPAYDGYKALTEELRQRIVALSSS
ncbi:MAG: 1-acyl-sn-glycerol-3-phosphate acyltransferase [Candidatus Saganbacteria bacterium]|nr:1-acyl-sn-glycerol-3-phosphate acyltransferase [Candidatus Saganbacteria bacterium]